MRLHLPPPRPLGPEAKARLRATLLKLAADAMSGPGGLAAWLRARKLGIPYAGKPLPLDMGKVKGIPDHLRRAVILRDRHCAWPGGCGKPRPAARSATSSPAPWAAEPASKTSPCSAPTTTRSASTASAGP